MELALEHYPAAAEGMYKMLGSLDALGVYDSVIFWAQSL
jgi:hypothetical protein